MAIIYTYVVRKQDGSCGKVFHNKEKAEAYGISLKSSEDEKIPITRSARGMASYTYYV